MIVPWSPSRFRRCAHPLLALVSLLLPTSIVALSAWQSIARWRGLGPFPAGKTEYDHDPVEALGGALHLYHAAYNSTVSSAQSVVAVGGSGGGGGKKDHIKGTLPLPPVYSELVGL